MMYLGFGDSALAVRRAAKTRRAYFNQTWAEDFTIMLIPVILMVECSCQVVKSRIGGVSAFANLVHNGRELQSLMSDYLEIT
jgi:hypothetical protein